MKLPKHDLDPNDEATASLHLDGKNRPTYFTHATTKECDGLQIHEQVLLVRNYPELPEEGLVAVMDSRGDYYAVHENLLEKFKEVVVAHLCVAV